MENYLFKIRFDGSAFHGWQMQKNAATVQESVENAIEKIFCQRAVAHGCSRTDAGVHANEYFFSAKLETGIPVSVMPRALSSALPPQIAVISAEEVPEDFHARFSCKKKEYIYKVLIGETPDPFLLGRAYHYKYGLDAEKLNIQAADFTGTHDFSAFCAAGSSVKSNIRTVYSFGVGKSGDIVEFKVCGDGFLYNMVRIMVGTLIDIQRGKIEENSIPQIIESADRNKAGVTVPACGLYLNKVYYED